MLAASLLVRPARVGDGHGSRLDVVRRKVLNWVCAPGDQSWPSGSSTKWKESDLGVLPINVGEHEQCRVLPFWSTMEMETNWYGGLRYHSTEVAFSRGLEK